MASSGTAADPEIGAAVMIDGRRHASDLRLSRRVVAYLAVLLGYFFYCYNFLLPGYVRPRLIDVYDFTLTETANITVAQNIGVTLGSIIAATVTARLGRRWAVAVIAIGSGCMTIGTIYVDSAWAWILMRGGIAFFLGGYYVAAVSLMVALFPQRYRARLQALNSGMFSGAEIVLGALGAAVGDPRWIWLIWFGGVPPLLIGMLMLAVVPDDRKIIGYGEEAVRDGPKASWGEMLSPRFRRITLTCILLAGANFTGYQLFTEFVTLYLRQARDFDAAEVGIAFSLIGLGSLLGGFFWAWISDRFGRRAPLWGFVGVAVFVLLFLAAPHQPTLTKALGFAYGFCLSCTYPWGVWFTEIFPARLRPYGAALYHGGHVVSLLAPLAVAVIAAHYGITAGMALAPVVFLAGAALWATLPETLPQGRAYRGWAPDQEPA